MNGPYEFLAYLSRLKRDCDRFEFLIWLLNAAIISIAIYVIFLLMGIPAFTRFYWQDVLPLAESTAILSMLLGATTAVFIRRRERYDFFSNLGSDLAEKTRAAYDNRTAKSLPMQKLAEELKIRLSGIKSSQILKWRRAQIRLALAALLLGSAVFVVHSQISADISPADFETISKLRDQALEFFQNETSSQNPSKVNLSGNIYGKPSLAVLDEAKLELQLYPGTAAGSRAIKSEPVDHVFQQSPPGEVSAVPSELYIESLPPENREIIKRYFVALSASTNF